MSNSPRDRAMRSVRAWAQAVERSSGVQGKHPLQQIRELGAGSLTRTRSPGGAVNARGSATRPSPSSRAPRFTPADEISRIMLELAWVDGRYWQTLLAWGLGWSLEDQARERKVSKATVAKWFEAGLAVVQFCQRTGLFHQRDDLTG